MCSAGGPLETGSPPNTGLVSFKAIQASECSELLDPMKASLHLGTFMEYQAIFFIFMTTKQYLPQEDKCPKTCSRGHCGQGGSCLAIVICQKNVAKRTSPGRFLFSNYKKSLGQFLFSNYNMPKERCQKNVSRTVLV